MVNAKALCYDDQNTKKMLKIEEEEHPVAIQIFGSDPEYMGGAAKILNSYPNEILDINMGCPAPKVVKNGDGSALLKNPELAAKVLKAVVGNSEKPVTLKIRKGWDDTCINAVEIAKIAEDCGISAIAIHGRTREQYYSGKADWDIIRQVKENVSIPKKHLKLAVEEHGEYVAVREMRKHIAWYLKGLRNSARVRDEINKIESYEEVVNKLESYMQDCLTLE